MSHASRQKPVDLAHITSRPLTQLPALSCHAPARVRHLVIASPMIFAVSRCSLM
jgi:hypothetical protein